MTRPFPEVVEVPPGLVQARLILGLPPLAMLVVLALLILPLALLGTWLFMPLGLALGAYIVVHARRDPQFLLVWLGEIRFRTYYGNGGRHRWP